MKSVVLAVICLYATQSLGHVDLVLAFMDEEIGPQTSALVRDHPESNIIVITRTSNGFDGKTLFGLPIELYGFSEGGRMDLTYEEFGMAIQHTLDSKLAHIPEKYKSLIHSPSAPKTVANEVIKTLSFSAAMGKTAKDCGPTIVIMQSPEMGKEPDLMAEYLEDIFEAVLDLPAARPENGGLRFFEFGTGGSAALSAKPGDVIPLQGASYIGSRRVGNSYQEIVSVIYGPDLKELTLYRSKKLFTSSHSRIRA